MEMTKKKKVNGIFGTSSIIVDTALHYNKQ